MVFFPAIVNQDQARNHWRRRDAIVALNDRLDVVCGEHLKSRALGRARNRMGIFPHEEWAIDAVRATVVTDGLCDRKDMPFRKFLWERGPAVAARAELDSLRRIVFGGNALVIVALELPHVD